MNQIKTYAIKTSKTVILRLRISTAKLKRKTQKKPPGVTRVRKNQKKNIPSLSIVVLSALAASGVTLPRKILLNSAHRFKSKTLISANLKYPNIPNLHNSRTEKKKSISSRKF
jgi:hypothetical protein